MICAASVEWLEDIVAFDEAGEWVGDGATSMSAWLAGQYGMARGTARVYEHDDMAALVRTVMGSACELSVPLEVNLSFGDSWATAK